ncbi:hypothetical protein WJ969_19175 [Achromobacter xylosoxidans]
MFETKEDGTTIYYYGRRDGHALGYHVDEAAMRSIRRLYVELFAASAFGISPAFTAGYRWTAMLLAAAAAVSFCSAQQAHQDTAGFAISTASVR